MIIFLRKIEQSKLHLGILAFLCTWYYQIANHLAVSVTASIFSASAAILAYSWLGFENIRSIKLSDLARRVKTWWILFWAFVLIWFGNQVMEMPSMIICLLIIFTYHQRIANQKTIGFRNVWWLKNASVALAWVWCTHLMWMTNSIEFEQNVSKAMCQFLAFYAASICSDLAHEKVDLRNHHLTIANMLSKNQLIAFITVIQFIHILVLQSNGAGSIMMLLQLLFLVLLIILIQRRINHMKPPIGSIVIDLGLITLYCCQLYLLVI